MTILLLDRLAPEAQSWLESRYALAYRPELATDAAGLRAALGRVQALLLTRKVVVTREFSEPRAPFARHHPPAWRQ
jgi:hypothetical protein